MHSLLVLYQSKGYHTSPPNLKWKKKHICQVLRLGKKKKEPTKNIPVTMLFSSCLSFLLPLKMFHFPSNFHCIILQHPTETPRALSLQGVSIPRELHRAPQAQVAFLLPTQNTSKQQKLPQRRYGLLIKEQLHRKGKTNKQ